MHDRLFDAEVVVKYPVQLCLMPRSQAPQPARPVHETGV